MLLLVPLLLICVAAPTDTADLCCPCRLHATANVCYYPCAGTAAQRKGYGRFLISFSYELSKKEAKVWQ